MAGSLTAPAPAHINERVVGVLGVALEGPKLRGELLELHVRLRQEREHALHAHERRSKATARVAVIAQEIERAGEPAGRVSPASPMARAVSRTCWSDPSATFRPAAASPGRAGPDSRLTPLGVVGMRLNLLPEAGRRGPCPPGRSSAPRSQVRESAGSGRRCIRTTVWSSARSSTPKSAVRRARWWRAGEVESCVCLIEDRKSSTARRSPNCTFPASTASFRMSRRISAIERLACEAPCAIDAPVYADLRRRRITVLSAVVACCAAGATPRRNAFAIASMPRDARCAAKARR